MSDTAPVRSILARLRKVKKSGTGWEACCPAHDDRRASLSVATGDDGRALLCCHAGCSTEEIVKALGLTMRDLYAPDAKTATYTRPTSPKSKAATEKHHVATYPYHDEAGKLLFEVVRYDPKDFRQRRPDGKRGHIWNLDGVRRVLYRLPELLAGEKGAWVFVCEGEKDVDNMRAVGLTATCNPGGAGKWKHVDDTPLHGRRVAIIPDRDKPGEAHARDVAARLYGKAADMRIVDMGRVRDFMGKDASDFLDANDSREPDELARELVSMADAAPSWTPDDWPEPTPLREATNEPPRFPVEALPAWLRDMVDGEAVATQTPPELAGSIGLAVLALAGAGKVKVEAWGGWSEPLNLFFAVALPPGCRKSAVFSAMTEPLVSWEKSQRERLGPEIAKAKAEYEILEKRRSALTKKAADGDAEAGQEVLRVSEELALKAVPVFPRLFTGDATPEAVARLLAEQGGRLGVFSAEGGELTAIAGGRYSNDGRSNMEVFLKGHAGDTIRVDRANREREPIILNNPALTLALCVQPIVLEEAWNHHDFAGRGLLARFMYAVPKNPLGTRDVAPPPVAFAILQGYEDAVLALLDMPKMEDGRGNPPAIALTDEASAMLKDFMARLEPDLGPGGRYESMSGWFGKLAGCVARIAGCLHLAGDPRNCGALQEPISAETMRGALALGHFYAAHAEHVHKDLGGTPEARTAARILDAIRRYSWRTFTERDLYRALGLRKDEARDGLTLLEETGHVRPANVADGEDESRPGRKPSRAWEVNPALCGNSVNCVNSVSEVGK